MFLKKMSRNTKFSERVWNLTARIPKGKVTTYKLIAEKLGTRAYRAVGSALNRNPYAPKVPCHRVVNSDGKIGGFAHSWKKKMQLLKSEGIEFDGMKIKDFKDLIMK